MKVNSVEISQSTHGDDLSGATCCDVIFIFGKRCSSGTDSSKKDFISLKICGLEHNTDSVGQVPFGDPHLFKSFCTDDFSGLGNVFQKGFISDSILIRFYLYIGNRCENIEEFRLCGHLKAFFFRRIHHDHPITVSDPFLSNTIDFL